MQMQVGTPAYMAPEVFDGQYSRGSDVWALGMVLWAMVLGQHPWSDLNSSMQIMRALDRGRRPPLDDVAPPLADILSKCWATDPKQRPRATEVTTCVAPTCHMAQVATMLEEAMSSLVPPPQQPCPQPWDFAWLQDLAGPDAQWTVDATMPSLRLADVPPSSKLFHLVCEQFAVSCRNGPTQLPFTAVEVVSVRAVHNSDLSTAFSLGLHITNMRRGTGLAAFNQPVDGDSDKMAAIQRLEKLFLSQDVFDHAHILYAFHGCSPDAAMAITRTGTAALRGTDGGFFGAGIYTTLQAQYAAGYATGTFGDIVTPTPDDCYAVLVCLVAVGNVYPVTRPHDYPPGSRVSVFHYNYPERSAITSQFDRKDKALKAGFDAHMVTISESADYEVAMEGDHGVWDELVVDQERQLLPIAIVYFRPREP